MVASRIAGGGVKATVLFLFTAGQTEVGNEKLAGARRHADALGWNLVPLVPEGGISAAFVRSAVSRLHPAGCIVDCSGGYEVPPQRLFGALPVVYLDVPAGIRGAAAGRTVSVDDAEVARAAFRELTAGMPATVAVVEAEGLPPWSRIRSDCFLGLASKKGLPCRIFHARRKEAESERAARLSTWLTALPRPCGVFAANDITGSEVTAACRALHLHVPREIALVGVDNIEARSNAPEAPFTSIRLDFERMGYLAAKALGEEMDIVHKSPSDNCPQIANGTNVNCGALGERALPLGADRRATRNLKFGTCGHLSQLQIENNVVGPLMVVRRKSTSGRGRHEPRIAEAVAMIRREACEGLTVATLAARFPGSRRLFDIRFREAMGHSALDEILHVRLERVCELLAGTDTPVTAVGDFCGFDRYQTLDKLFRQRFKMSMRQWRLRNSRKFFSQK